jgi:D-3-phosphoglycerate dehydrogenase
MKILAFADCFVPVTVMRSALEALHPAKLTVLPWAGDDEADLHHRVRRIEQLGPTAEAPPQEAWSLASEVDLIVTHMCPVGATLIEKATRLAAIGVCRAGVENVDLAAVDARRIRLYNVPGRNAVAVAEFTIGLILAELRNISRAARSIASGEWQKRFSNEGRESQISGKTVGIIGFGLIGQTVARLLDGFGARLLACDPWQSPALFEHHRAQAVSLEHLLRESDIVTLHARASPGDPPIIGPAQFRLMKRTALLINTARAMLVDTSALCEALRSGQIGGGQIGGAAVDVFEEEPLDRDHPLRYLENVTLTPHLAGSTIEAFHHSPRLLVERIQQDLRFR